MVLCPVHLQRSKYDWWDVRGLQVHCTQQTLKECLLTLRRPEKLQMLTIVHESGRMKLPRSRRRNKKFTESLLCARHLSRSFIYIDSLNHPSPYDENTTTIPFSQIRDQSKEVKSLVQHLTTSEICGLLQESCLTITAIKKQNGVTKAFLKSTQTFKINYLP